MTYKAFEDFYRETKIRHLLLEKHNDVLISPPFTTERCRDYSSIAVYDGKNYLSYVDLNLPDATSKVNAVARVNDTSWLIPYGIWDNLNIVIELKDLSPTYHTISKPGKGQFYSIASNGTSACSFPLGYEDTNYIIYIDKNGLRTINFETDNKKCHMGTVYCNGKYWSMPRGDLGGYNNLVSFDPYAYTDSSMVKSVVETHHIPVEPSIPRKFTDLIVDGETLYSLPYGETAGLNSVVEINTNNNEIKLHELDVPDFAKKYNAQVLVEDTIIGLPYGDEHSMDSETGVCFNTITKKSKAFNLGLGFGGKYRFRSGIAYKGKAIFLPSGTPTCPIVSVNVYNGIIRYDTTPPNKLFGRPIIFKGRLLTIVYDMKTTSSTIVEIGEDLSLKEVIKI